MISLPHFFRTIGAFTLPLVALSLLPSATLAQEVVGIKITPSLIEERADPGAELSYTMRIDNQGGAPQVLYPRVRDILGTDDGGQPIFAKDDDISEYALSSWVIFKESSLSIPAGGGGELHVIVRIPQDVTPGAHVGSITLGSKPLEETKMGSAVGYEVGSILSFRVSGEIVEDTRLREFFVDRFIYKTPDVHFTARVENLGNVFVRPKGFVDIRNMWGAKVDTLTVNDGGASVFPKAERKYSIDWKSDKFAIGKYTAELSLAVEGAKGVETLLATAVFWVIPMDVVFPVLGGILVFLLLFYVLLRLYIRKQVARMTGGIPSVRTKEVTSLSRLTVVVIALLLSVVGGILLLFLLG